jgi:hypothetical protein
MLDVKKLSLAATMDRLRGKKFSRGKIVEKNVAAYESWREEQVFKKKKSSISNDKEEYLWTLT